MRTALFLLLAAPLALPAATIVQTSNFGSSDFDVTFGSDDPLNATYFTQLIGVFDQFDPTLGTLNSAIFTYTISFDVSALSSVENESIGIAGGGSFRLDTDNIVYGGGLSGSGSAISGESPISFSAYIESGPGVPGLAFNLVEGTGQFTLGWYGEPMVFIRSQANTEGEITASGFITVTYDYTPAVVPEPSAAAALAGAFVLAGALLRRRR